MLGALPATAVAYLATISVNQVPGIVAMVVIGVGCLMVFVFGRFLRCCFGIFCRCCCRSYVSRSAPRESRRLGV